MAHPRQRAGQSFDEHQAEMAAWLGVSVEAMNLRHDPLHAALAALTGRPSHALRFAAGEKLTPAEQALASIEEEAVLHLQRYLHHAENAR